MRSQVADYAAPSTDAPRSEGLSAAISSVTDMTTAPLPTRPTYPELVAAIDALMEAHSAEIRGGRTEELRAATNAAHGQVAQLVYAATDRPERPSEPDDDPLLPIRRDGRRP